MLENFSKTTELKFTELSPEEKEARGILGRLYGPMASIVRPTRNGRKYTDSLWEKAFQNPLVQELFTAGGIPGELDHPADREETCSEKIAIMMPEAPTKGPDGQLIGYFDIIDTPCGKIAYALAKYGFNLGISSRGTGDTYEDHNGDEIVDEDTYNLNAFDLVLLPACKDARLKLAESYDVKKARFKEAINEAIESVDEGAKKIMTETLENLKFGDSSSSETKVEETVGNETKEADDDGSELVEALQEALKENSGLRNQVVALQEKLSVSYTKEIKLEESIATLKDTVKRLAGSVAKSANQDEAIKHLQESLQEQTELVAQQNAMIEAYKTKLQSSSNKRRALSESIESQTDRISQLQEKLSLVEDRAQKSARKSAMKIESLENELSALRTDSEVQNAQYSKKLAASTQLVEKYRATAIKAVERYIESKAVNLGIAPQEIRNRLQEGYSFDDIDHVCEELRNYKRNISKLPFAVSGASVQRVALHEDTSTKRFTNPDDVVDSDLFNMIN